MPGIGGEFWILGDFEELSFCGPYGPIILSKIYIVTYYYDVLHQMTPITLPSKERSNCIMKS